MKTIVYIDGQNFLYKAAEVLLKFGLIADKQDLTAIDMPPLMKKILGDDDIEIRFYGVGKIKRRGDLGQDILTKSIRFADNARRVRNSLIKQGVQFVEAGKLKVRDSDVCKVCGSKDYRFQEKGVDVGMAVDMVADAILKDVDRVVLVSSDTDLIPAVKRVQQAGVEIIYVGFSERLTPRLVALVKKTITITDEQIVEVFSK
ncbi:NYN domain-containing protein [Candidatus Saccharibacteria bacterium]|nr:NYN domain-containing protein [Candidatus Saccharibacteria bacterium]